MIRVVTDSSSQLDPDQRAGTGIAVVPIVVRIDDREYREGEDLDADGFYSMLREGMALSTSQPAPGDFVETYNDLTAGGATEIISVHVSEEASGTLNAARLAAEEVDVPVRLVDSRTTSYGLGVVALEIADRIGQGATVEAAVAAAESLIPHLSTVFILQDLRYVLRGGRIRRSELPTGATEIPVLAGSGGSYGLIGTGRRVDELVEMMAGYLLAGDHERHVAIALAAPDTIEFTTGLEEHMRTSSKVVSLHRYRMGASIAVHTGPGTAGGFAWPA